MALEIADHYMKGEGSVPISVFSVQPPCSLCLCGNSRPQKIHHRDTERTENAQSFSEEAQTKKGRDSRVDGFAATTAKFGASRVTVAA
jgi:hypothetical protein